MNNPNSEWDTGILEGSFEDKRNQIFEKVEKFVEKWGPRDDYTKDSKLLLEALNDFETLNRKYMSGGDEYYYYWLKLQLDESNPEIKARYNKITEFVKEISNRVLFFKINLSKIEDNYQREFIDSPLLRDYKHYLEQIFRQSKHILNEGEEKILSLKTPGSYDFWMDMVSGFLSKEEATVLDENGDEVKKSFSYIKSLTENPNKKIRDRAIEEFNKIVEKYEDVAENEINAILENKKIEDKIRNHVRADESRLIEDDVDISMVDTLIKSVRKRYDISKRYYKLKAELLGFKNFSYSERNIIYEDKVRNFSYEESCEIIKKVFSSLNKEFLDIFENYLENSLIDAFPKKGKRSGAFCAHNLESQPTYIMLNHTNKLNDVLTLAHEVGHGINNELMKKYQNSLNFDTPKSVAEVASTFMEDFVLQELMKNADDEEKFVLLIQKLNSDMTAIIRQIACYEFEQELHEEFRKKGYLSKEEIGRIFSKHMKDYLGEIFREGKDLNNGWIYWPHIREYFYVYSYASGLLISKALQAMVKQNSSNIEKVKKFLSAGTSKSPRDIFLELGIDISDENFWHKGLDEIENLLNEAEALAKKLGKI